MHMFSNNDLLKHHSGILPLSGDLVPSLASTLRPCIGCNEASFADCARVMVSEHENLSTNSTVNRELVLSLLTLCQTIRILAVAEKSPIRRNKVATMESLIRLEAWLDVIESFTVSSLARQPAYVCTSRLIHYICFMECSHPELYGFLIPFASEAAIDKEFGITDEAENALLKLNVKSI